MRIKNLLIYTLPFYMLLQSCDKIDSPFSTSANSGSVDTSIVPQRVLLEEYTGHTCPNCPAAHDEAQTLLNTYGKQLIVVSVHAGYYAQTQSGTYSYDFRTQVGNDLFAAFLPTGQSFPTGVIQRKKNSQGNYPIPWSSWGTNIATLISAKPSAKIDMVNSYNAATRTITCTVTNNFLKDISSSLSLSVLYTEDSIVKPQKNGTVSLPAYTHRHVLRGSLNGSWGETIGSSFISGQSLDKTYTGAPISADAVPEHISVVAILYNTTTNEVIQVAEKKLIE